ncbi:MAG: histidine kinase [Bacteroidales bacterium]|nr:histidine kinase [Bacteroidales bacterium]
MKMVKSRMKIIFRIVLVSLYAILVLKLVDFAMPDDITFTPALIKFIPPYVLIFILNTEGCLFFDRFLNKQMPWSSSPQKRLIIQFALIIIWSLITMGIPFTIWYFYNGKSLVYPPASVIVFIGSIVLMLGFISVSIAINFFKQWQNSILDAEHYMQEKLKADYKVLQNQVNPHFLFNSFNVLVSEIKHNPDVAVEFTRKLSKVYRYVLQSKNYDLISLRKELDFIESYIFLHKVRIGEALKYSIDIADNDLQKQLPTLTLQILVENATKHNIANEENVLNITIKSGTQNNLIVSNNLNPKNDISSTRTGLSNLQNRYSLLNKDGFEIKKNDNEFIVLVPLIEE